MTTLCGCGKPLIPVLHEGRRIGVTHTSEDDDHHLAYFAELSVSTDSQETERSTWHQPGCEPPRESVTFGDVEMCLSCGGQRTAEEGI